jgi:hypothetical protein
MRTLTERIRDAILGDTTDRQGWRQEWDGFDNETQEEIAATWLKLIQSELNREVPKA